MQNALCCPTLNKSFFFACFVVEQNLVKPFAGNQVQLMHSISLIFLKILLRSCLFESDGKVSQKNRFRTNLYWAFKFITFIRFYISCWFRCVLSVVSEAKQKLEYLYDKNLDIYLLFSVNILFQNNETNNFPSHSISSIWL